MSITSASVHPPITALPPQAVLRWVEDTCEIHENNGLRCAVRQGDDATLITVTALEARRHMAAAFTDVALSAYQLIGRQIEQHRPRSLVRMWNFIPGIHDPMDDSHDRYMAFNAGRFAAMCDWFDGEKQLERSVPAASGVGIAGEDLVIHALLLDQRGEALENPLQRPTVRYSARYGPRPPCFARATRVRRPRDTLLFVSGTASITDEASMHVGDLDRQLELTFTNLRALVRAAGASSAEDPLGTFESMRVYVPPSADEPRIAEAVAQMIPASAEIELTPVELCRAELLVEIEGIAAIPRAN